MLSSQDHLALDLWLSPFNFLYTTVLTDGCAMLIEPNAPQMKLPKSVLLQLFYCNRYFAPWIKMAPEKEEVEVIFSYQ
jgi:hypothetical protein